MISVTHTNSLAHAARLGPNHGYRIDGDIALLHAEVAVEEQASAQWALQLWACEQPFDGGTLQGVKVAEAALPAGVANTQRLDAEAVASVPGGLRDYSMVLVLASGANGAFDQIHDFANYPARERFITPHLEGSVGYQVDGDSVMLRADSVRNPRRADNLSGSLALELWALPDEYRGGPVLGGTLLASVDLGRIAGQSALQAFEQRAKFEAPREGRWNVVLMLREWVPGGYVTRDFCTFAEQYVVEVKRADEESVVAEPVVDAKRADAEPLAAEPFDAEPVDAEPIVQAKRADAEPVDAEHAPAKRADAEQVAAEQVVDAKRADAEPILAEHAQAKRADAEQVAAEPVVDAKRADAEPIGAEPVLEAKTEDVVEEKAEPIKAEAVVEAKPVAAAKSAPEALLPAELRSALRVVVSAPKAAPAPAEAPRASVDATPAARIDAATALPVADGKISLMTATVEQIAQLKGLTKKVAVEVVKGRPYASIDELTRVRGIGPKLLAKLRGQITL